MLQRAVPRELHRPEREADHSVHLAPTLSTSGAIPLFLKVTNLPVCLLMKSIFVYNGSSFSTDTVFLMLHLGMFAIAVIY